MKKVLLIILFIAFAVAMYIYTKPANDAYNEHVCAVYGYKEDCKTPLPEEERLK